MTFGAQPLSPVPQIEQSIAFEPFTVFIYFATSTMGANQG